ncbi:hypothetical protein D6779_08355 [Candidatus Parcubacteria bacterium]|nr:MAG: hypothetical protein D6779_08355 [Candidatus Parcubacteria bacterium]
MKIPSPDELKAGYQEFQRREKRDAMYKVASFLVAHFWGKPADMADGLGVLLLTWNQALYRYGSFDFESLEKCITENMSLLEKYRERNILSYSPHDDKDISHLFQAFLAALEISDGSKAGTRSPVATSKALHLLAPEYFPLWDDKIAKAYGCHYAYKPAAKYLTFIRLCKQIAAMLQPMMSEQNSGKTLLKLIDEYNYAKYTKGWV